MISRRIAKSFLQVRNLTPMLGHARSVVVLKREAGNYACLREEIEPFPSKSFGSLTARLLTREREIHAAKRMLYIAYVVEGGWRFQENNPTGFQVVGERGKEILTDRWDDHANWFGVFRDDELITSVRTLQSDNEGNLDITLYKDIQNEATTAFLTQLDTSKYFEVQRSVTSRQHRNYGSHYMAVSALLSYAYSLKKDPIFTTPVGQIVSMYLDFDLTDLDLKFNYGDGIDTRLFKWDWFTLPKIVAMIDDKIEERLEVAQRRSQATR